MTADVLSSRADDLWIFGYGSLMWRPGFDYVERSKARMIGFHRSLCILSHVHRGTPEKPGLVLGLDRGGSCRGVAFRVEPAKLAATIDYLREREQVTAVYIEIEHSVTLDDGRKVRALAYKVDRHHPQYCGRLTNEKTLVFVQQGVGVSGENPAYVLATQDHLAELGIHDSTLAWLSYRLRAV